MIGTELAGARIIVETESHVSNFFQKTAWQTVICVVYYSMKFNKGDKIAHKLNPLRWRGEVTEVKLNGRIKVMLTNDVEVEVPSSCLRLDVFTNEEVEIMLEENYAS